MNCGLQNCSGRYEDRTVSRAFEHGGETVVIEGIPAEVCDVCGDILLTPETLRNVENVLRTRGTPARTVPLYEYAS